MNSYSKVSRFHCRLRVIHPRITQMSALRADNDRLQELVAVKDAQLVLKKLLTSLAEEVKLLKRELQLRVAPLDASNPKRQRMHDNCSGSSIVLSPLEKEELLDEVFSFVGGGAVRCWREQTAERQIPAVLCARYDGYTQNQVRDQTPQLRHIREQAAAR
jgi:hypothetical protein